MRFEQVWLHKFDQREGLVDAFIISVVFVVVEIENLQFEKCAVHFNPTKGELLFDALVLLLLFVAHILETELFDLVDDAAQMVHQTFVFNLVSVKETPILTLYTMDYLVSELQNHLTQDGIMENHQNKHAFEVSI